jgi:hypothetical protein
MNALNHAASEYTQAVDMEHHVMEMIFGILPATSGCTAAQTDQLQYA